MAEIKDGGPAFPELGNVGYNSDWQSENGMRLRDYFAGQALAGYFAAPNTPHQNAASKDVAEYMYAMADAMLAARTSPDARQNAHLIAAAPDLIDALVMALPYVEVCEADPAYKAQHVKNVVKQIRAALAKASPQDNGE